MPDFAEEPILLAATRNGSDLVLRIDSNLWDVDLAPSDRVRVLTIHDARVRDAENPAAWVGHHIYLNERSEDGTHLVELYINFAVDYVEVVCKSTSQQLSAYSKEDLAGKLAAVADVARRYATESNEAQRELQRIRREVGSKLRRELDVGERKRQFFANSHPDRAHAIESELKLLRVLAEKLERSAAT